jgi:hypothetical protein
VLLLLLAGTQVQVNPARCLARQQLLRPLPLVLLLLVEAPALASRRRFPAPSWALQYLLPLPLLLLLLPGTQVRASQAHSRVHSCAQQWLLLLTLLL